MKNLVTTPEGLRSLREKLVNAQEFVFDTETTGLRWWKDKIFLMSFHDGTEAYLVPVKAFSKSEFQVFFIDILRGPEKKIIGQNIKFDLHFVLSNFGVYCYRGVHDTMVMSHLMDETKPKGLKPTCERLLGIAPEELDLVEEWLKDHIPAEVAARREALEERGGKKWYLCPEYNYSHVPDEIMYPYALQDAVLTWRLYNHHKPSIEANFKTLYQTEMELLPIVLEMEQAGVPVNTLYLEGLQETLQPDLEDARAKFDAIAGVPVNLDSPTQLAKYLYSTLALPVPFKTAKGQPSTSQDALEKLQHPVIESLLAYSYANSRLKMVNNLVDFVDNGVIHAGYDQTGTVSGRFACNSPNLMNISNDPLILRAFTVDPKNSMFHWDYSLLEMIPMAIYSKDVRMLSALEEGKDLHRLTASGIFRVPYEEVTKVQRKVGKGSNFAIVFGVGAAKFTQYVNGYLGDDEKITTNQGLEYRDRYHKRFPGTKALMQKVIQTIHSEREPLGHYVRGQFGRIRRLPVYFNKEGKRVDPAYQGTNFLCQNFGADLMKMSMVKLKKGVLKNLPIRQQIHDCIRVDAKFQGKERDEFVREVNRTMCDWDLPEGVPLKTECTWSNKTWADLTPYGEK